MSQTRIHFATDKPVAERLYALMEVAFEDDGFPLAIFAVDEEERLHEVRDHESLVLFGRHASCDVVLDDEKRASRQHCQIERQPDGTFLLRDLSSANGTKLNGQEVTGAVALTPGDKVRIAINETQDDRPLLYAAFTGDRHELTDAKLMRLFVTHPLMTLKVTASIHFEALRLIAKGIRIRWYTGRKTRQQPRPPRTSEPQA